MTTSGLVSRKLARLDTITTPPDNDRSTKIFTKEFVEHGPYSQLSLALTKQEMIKRRYSRLALAVLCILLVQVWRHRADTTAAGSQLFCYYSSSSQLRTDVGKFEPEDVDPGLCTHVIFAFVDLIKGTTFQPGNANDLPNGKDPGLYGRTVALRRRNPSIKILLAVGGWRAASAPFVEMIKGGADSRRLFVRNAVRYLRQNDFDGLDVDWEFPGARGSDAGDRILFTAMLKDLREAFDRESEETSNPKLLLTIAVSGGSYYISLAYESKKIVRYVDYVLVMAYNYHGSWNDYTGHHSALHPRSDEVGGEREWNQAWSIDYWLNEAEAPRSKVVLGLATYGMTFTLADPSKHGMKATASGAGSPGKYTQEAGTLAYYEVCENLKNGWTSVWEEEQKVPYAYQGDQWVGFDDPRSITHKVEHLRKKGLAGAFIWSLDMDDFKGSCGEGKYPLLSTIYKTLREGSPNSEVATPRSNNDGDVTGFDSTVHRRPTDRGEFYRRSVSKNDDPELDRSEQPGSRRRRPERQRTGSQDTANDGEGFVGDEGPALVARSSIGRSQKRKSYDEGEEDGGIAGSRGSPQLEVEQNPGDGGRSTRKLGRRRHGNDGFDWFNGVRSKVGDGAESKLGSSAEVAISASSGQSEDGSGSCSRSGLFPDSGSCHFYYICVQHGSRWVKVRLECPQGLGFNPSTAACGKVDGCD